ncbi:hypothetical protein [Sphingorhabdus lacus]|uniref:Uncharacterized protein n=1 Tax=Sphingorhabdus lacus TaxID=392610 RepID=A0A6I6L9T0_9SPHN|nr:hypothetical protein [Sphingorhabdus lacus]QGY80806.1 hypothetical protein EUU25_09350 [Sphingorhabdus lacus]
MPAPTAKLGVKWLSPTDIRSTLDSIHTNRNAHSNLLRRLTENVERHRQQVSESLRSLDAKDRPSVVAKSVSGKRLELVRETADQRLAHTRELVALSDRIKSAAIHYKSPVQMLMRDTLGSERRSRIMQQIANSGPVELASLAEFAAATSDKELAAALCSRVSDLNRIDRPFSSVDLANVLCGELHRELGQAILEAERRVLEALNEDTEFETGKPNPQRSVEIAMLKKREQEVGAYQADDEVEEGAANDDAALIDDTPTGRIESGLQSRRNPGSTPANPV